MELLHFEISEFDCPSLQGSGINMDKQFLQMLDDARGIAGIPFHITSGYRTHDHNAKLINSVKNSAHTRGKAVDIAVKDSRSRFIIVDALIKVGFNRLGLADTFIHVDNDDLKDPNVIWTYS